jgi:hypothetical protein
MPDLSTRINALIAYLFLGPIMLLARPGTPLTDPYVRGHAKKASLIIVLGGLAFSLYRSLHGYLAFGIFGISLDLLVVSAIVSITLLLLIVWAYRAYHGVGASISSYWSLWLSQSTLTDWSYSEEDRIRIIASFVPWVGIIIESIHPSRETLIWRKVGSFFAFITLTTLVFLSGTTTTLMFILTTWYIALIVVTGVQLFVSSRFLEFSLYTKIPTYTELDAHIKAGVLTGYDYCRVAFGGAKVSNYEEIYQSIISNTSTLQHSNILYPLPLWIIWLPIANLITLPSLWQVKYREYTPLILQWLTLTSLTIIIIWFYGANSQMGLYLLFPIIALIVGSRDEINTRAPLTSIVVDIYSLCTRGQAKISEVKANGEEKVGYSYEVK